MTALRSRSNSMPSVVLSNVASGRSLSARKRTISRRLGPGVSVATGNTAFAVSPAIVATSIARTTATVTVTAANTLLVGDYVNLTSAITNAAGTAMDYRPGIKLVATRSATQFTYAEAAPAAIASRAVTASFRRYVGSAVGQMTRTTTVVTVNTATAHDLAVGNVVALTPGEAGYWGGWKTVDTVPLPTRFTYREAIAVAPPASTRVQYFVKTSTRAKTPFNTADTLQNARENGSHQIRLWRASNNKVINVKSQFNSENVATGTGFASHHNLNQFNKRYGTKAINNGAWEAYTTKDGVLLTGATGGELAGLHCSDCHLNETNAHGTRNTWYMLSSRDQGTQEPFDVATANSSLVTSNDNCVKCHNRGTYGQNGTLGANSRTAGHQECGRWDGNQTMAFLGATWSSGTTYTGGTLLCLGCHGGRGDTHLGPGLIHGTNENYSPGETGTQKMYRFMGSGPSYPFYSPDGTAGATNWSGATTGSCYNLPSGTATAWGACDQHNSLTDQAVTNRAGRALSY